MLQKAFWCIYFPVGKNGSDRNISMTITIDPETCTRCGTCTDVCTMAIIEQPEQNELPHLAEGKSATCISCGQCEVYCPTGAITQDSVTAGSRTGGDPAAPDKILPGPLGMFMKSRRSIRKYQPNPVPKETIEAILDIARYAPSAMNGQPVGWLVIEDPKDVRKVASLTVDWMRELVKTDHPLSAYAPRFIAGWDNGTDVICHRAPHLLVAHIPADNPMASNDAIIALTHVDIAAPAFGLGTCWAGLVAMASFSYKPLRDFLSLPKGRAPAYAMMIGYPKYKPHQIPDRKPLQVTWRK
jgi:nitroreductase/NAD-dependent dihydropyrimidine dehydrogenase PreA subunit